MYSRIPVFILAGGKGERLSGVTDLPKPLIEIAGRPFVSYLLAGLGRQGFRRIFFLTGYRAEEFEQLLTGSGSPGDPPELEKLEIRFLREEHPLGTGGALRRALLHIEQTALVLNGDSCCLFDYRELLRLHAARDGALCLTAAWVEDAADFGRLTIDEKGLVTGFHEKGSPGPGWINAGIYVMPREFLETAVPEGAVSLEREILPLWVGREKTWAHQTRAYFCDIGTPERLARARRELPAANLLSHS